MKVSHNLIRSTTIAAALLLIPHLAHASVSLNVSPASITNDYVGNVTLTITGLTTGQQVKVKRFYDLNGNNVIDGQDMPIESFGLADGQLPLIGGVRNANVPGDDDGTANGQIQAKLHVPGISSVAGGATGNFIFRIEDTNGNSLATQTFSVAQKVRPQGLRGKITVSGVPQAYLPVALVDINNGSPVLAVTDSGGNYSFYAQPGNYTVVAAGTGYISDQMAGFESLGTNQFITNNISLASGAYTLSGSVTDMTSGKPLGAIFINAQSTNNLFTGAFTDTNGNYSLPVNNNQWKIDVDQGAVAEKGYLSLQNKPRVTIAGASMNNVNFALPKATALIFGTLKDSSNNPIANVQMNAGDNSSTYEGDGLTISNGSYTVGVFSNSWNVGPSSDSLTALGYTSGAGTNVNIANNQAVEADFVLVAANTHLRGQVKDDHGNPISNISLVVQPYPVQGNGAQSIYPNTDANGNFDVGVSGGTWNIALECVSAQNRGYVNESGPNYNFTVTSGVDQNGILLTFPQSTATISGTVMDTGGHPIVGVELDASQNIGPNASYYPGCAATDGTGHYQINVLSGTWNVAVRNSDLNAQGYGSISSQNFSAGTSTANFVAPLNIAPPQFSNGSYSPSTGTSFNIIGTVGHTNTVQYSSNLVTWLTLTNAVLNNSTWHVTDPTLNQPKRFYRAFVSP